MPSTTELEQSDPLAGRVAATATCIRAEDLLAGRARADDVRVACLQTGFFFVDPTPSQRDTIAATFAQMKCFFSLDDADSRKRNSRDAESESGWVPRYSEPAYQPGTVSRLEGFDFGLGNVDESRHGIWPPLPGFRTDCVRCWRDCIALGDALLEIIARAAGMEPEFLVERCSSRSLNSMRLLHYEGETATSPDEEVGIAAHTDFECITLICQTAPGLELLDANGRWLDAPAREGRIVVLLDDMLERWTNGYFKATGHRVRKTPDPRSSIVLFIAANEDLEIAPLPRFVSADRPLRYETVTQARHIARELRRAKRNRAAMAGRGGES